MNEPSASPGPDPSRGSHLDSWKEIAAYLKRDIRTVQRWEKQEGLPVHRHLHHERGTAYAYSDEIDQWLEIRSDRDKNAAASIDAPVSEDVRGSTLAALPRTSRRLSIFIAAVLASVAGVIGIWSAVSRSRPEPTPLSSLSIVFGPSVRFREWGPDFALSPDGSTLVYTAGGGLRVRRIDQLEERALEGTDGSTGPFFSPDGRWIGFRRVHELMKVSIEGGAPVALGAKAGFIGAADWGSDDHIVYAAITPEGSNGLYRVPANGGTPQLIAALEGKADEAYWLTPQALSNGKVILSTLARSIGSSARFQVVTVSVGTGERRLLVDDARHGLYLGDGVLVYLRNDALFAIKLDTNRLEVRGPHVPAWDDVHGRVRLRSWVHAAGTLVYWPNLRAARRLVWVDRAGKQELLPLPPALYQSPRLSPDGQSLAFGIGDQSEIGDVWKHDLSTGTTVQLTTNGRSGTPLWTPDGTRIILSSLSAAGRDLVQLRVNGTAEPEPIHVPPAFLSGATKEPVSWANNGRTLIVRQVGLESQPPLWAVALDGGREVQPVLAGRATDRSNGRISPDGRWLAYQADQLYVAPFPDGRRHWKLSGDGGGFPVWARSGRELFYLRGGRMMSVPVTLTTTVTSGTPRVLFEGQYFEAEPGSPNYDISLDDQRFLMVLPGSTEGPDRLNVVQGWKAEILRRLRESR